MAYEIIHGITLVILWGGIALNVWTLVRTVRLNKRLEAERKYCLTMVRACNEFLEATHKESGLVEEASDESKN